MTDVVVMNARVRPTVSEVARHQHSLPGTSGRRFKNHTYLGGWLCGLGSVHVFLEKINEEEHVVHTLCVLKIHLQIH